MPAWVRFRDEFDDTIIAVDLLARVLPGTVQEPLLWKWIIIAVHNGLQGAMVCALSGTDGTGALSDRSARKVQDWLETLEGAHPEPWMADFPLLMERARDAQRVHYGPPLVLSDEDINDLHRLNRLRRGCMHFTPKGWSIETEGLPRIILVAVSGIEQLMLRNDRILAHLGEDRLRHLETDIRTIRELLNQNP